MTGFAFFLCAIFWGYKPTLPVVVLDLGYDKRFCSSTTMRGVINMSSSSLLSVSV